MNKSTNGAVVRALVAILTMGIAVPADAASSSGIAETIDFEGLVKGINHIELTDYDGFTWIEAGAVGKRWALRNGYGADTGFLNDAHGKAVGYTLDQNGITDSTFTADSGTFTLKSGYFASAWMRDGEDVTFTAYRDGEVVATETVTLTTQSSRLKFGKGFAHINTVQITANSGTDSDSNVVMDNLKVFFDTQN